MTTQAETMLRVSHTEAAKKLTNQIAQGEQLLAIQLESDEGLNHFLEDKRSWLDYSKELLRQLFTTELLAMRFHNSGRAPGVGAFDDIIEAEKADLTSRLCFIRSLIKRLELIPENLPSAQSPSAVGNSLHTLHPEIYSKCHALYEKGAYAEAAEKGFKVVRDRLRNLTTYETGSEAFGKGKLHVKGATAPHVDRDFNEGVKFLTMAIDQFRNEKVHTSDAKIEDPIRALEYLGLSSLAMNLLDNAEIPKQNTS
ncbi:MAG: TIGR02391 family protein [Nitrospirae bacterium]|nr:TIGR02391 family protein [Nitrospirota bacterium]